MSCLSRDLRFDAARGVLLAERASACGSCRLASGCGSRLLTQESISIRVPNGGHPDVLWRARFPAEQLLVLCAAVFPGLAALLLVSDWLAQQWFPAGGDAAACIGLAAGMVVGAACLRLYHSSLGRRFIQARLVIVPSGQGAGNGT